MRTFFTKFIFWILVFCSATLCGQHLEWVKGFGGLGPDQGNQINLDKFGNIYTVGSFYDSLDFDTGIGITSVVSNGLLDGYISKTDESGNFLWVKTFGGNGDDRINFARTDNLGNLYIVGDFIGIVDFDPGISTYSLSSNGGSDIFICKLDSDGNFNWAKTFGGPLDEVGTCLQLKDENIYISGAFEDTVDFDPSPGIFNLNSSGNYDAFISKLDTSGNFIWAKTFGGNSFDAVHNIALDNHKNIYLAGNFSNTVDFDPGIGVSSYASNGSTDIFVSKLDSIGNFILAKKIGGTSSDKPNDIAIDSLKNIYVIGYFNGVADFNPDIPIFNLTSTGSLDAFVCKLDSNYNFKWAKRFGGSGADNPYSIEIDNRANLYLTGSYSSTVDFNPNNGIYNLQSIAGSTEAFISVLDSLGNFISAEKFGGTGWEIGYSIKLKSDKIFLTGRYGNIINFNYPNNIYNLSAHGNDDVFVAQYRMRKIFGFVYKDVNSNCTLDVSEFGIPNYRLILNPGNIVVETNSNGRWEIDSLPIGNYTLTFDTSGNWQPNCLTSVSFSVNNTNNYTSVPSIGLSSTQICPYPEVTITAPFLRRCFSNQIIYVQACNQITATSSLTSAYVDVELDSLITPMSASLAYITLGNNKYRFNIGNLNPGQCSNFSINTTVSCNAILNQTLCMQAQLFPSDSCVFDTIPATPIPGDTVFVTPCNLPWDHSSLSVNGYCANDTVYFTITNNGSASNGNMLCYAPVRIYVDGVLTYVDSIMLGGGQTITYSYPGNGQTWILQADQHPLHPGNSHPNAHVEACGNLSNWTPNLVNNLPLDDADPIKDIYCGVVSGAYDPNDKTGFPTGLGTLHEVLPNQQIQYQIRFQNTGNDTAFNIVIRDTLDTDLNIFSVVPGVASHAYSFRMYGPRVLEWTFNNIMLPDSNINEPLSHGFATFRVDQQTNLTNGTTILNDADIYFDFNDPIITNETVHTINNQLHNFAVGVKTNEPSRASGIVCYPNPANDLLNIELLNIEPSNFESNIKIENVLGQVVYSSKTKQAKNSIDISKLSEGIYIITVENKNTKQSVKVVKY